MTKCNRLYGFNADPEKSLTKNFNLAFRARDCRLIKNQPTNLAFHNLCTLQQPPSNTGKLLGLNLKFCVATSTPKPDLKHTVSRLIRSVRTQNMLVQNKVKSQNFIPQLYKKDTFYTPPLATDEIEYQLSEFDKKLEEETKAISNTCKYNLTPEQRKVLLSLQGNKDFIILPSDKNLGPAIMDREIYMNSVLTEHLLTDSYLHIEPEDAATLLRNTENNLKYHYRQNLQHFSKAERQYFERSFKENHRTPMFYIVPKVQKEPVKFRPVVSCIKSFNAIFSTWLDFKMKSLLKCIPTYLKDSNDLLKALRDLPKLPSNARLFTADATAMYTNIDADTAIEAFTYLFDHYEAEIPIDFPKSFFLTVLEIIMKQNLFQFDNTFWLQKDGTAMGTPAACLYATISYGIHERNKLLPNFQHLVTFYKRYIDDVLGIWIPLQGLNDEAEWQAFQDLMNAWGKLRWIVSDRSNEVNFLDLTLTLENGHITTKTYQKPMNLYLYIPPTSAHPTSCYKGLIVGNFLRFRKQNNDANFCNLLGNFAHHLIARGHSLNAVKNHFKKAADIIDKKALQQLKQTTATPQTSQLTTTTNADPEIANRSLYLHWEYHPHGIQKDKLRAIYNDTIQNCNPFANGMTIALSRPQNLRDLLTKTTLNEPAGKQASDYYKRALTKK
jgi:hypothetical protein